MSRVRLRVAAHRANSRVGSEEEGQGADANSANSRTMNPARSLQKTRDMRDDDILLNRRAHRGSGSATPVTRTPIRRDDDMVFKRRPSHTPTPERADDDRQG